MALQVCNNCGAKFSGQENCPQCLASGEGEVRDYHYQHEEVATESTTEDAGIVIPEDEEVDDTSAAEDAYDQSHPDEDPNEDLSGHSKNRLVEVARERGLDASGTKAELLARLQGDGQG